MDNTGVFKDFVEILLVNGRTFIIPQDLGIRRLWDLTLSFQCITNWWDKSTQNMGTIARKVLKQRHGT